MAKVTKLSIKAGSDSYEAMFNPETVDYSASIQYTDSDEEVPQGKYAVETNFKRYDPETLSFDLIIDGTGATGVKKDVATDLRNLKKVVYNYKSKKHEPNVVNIAWGKAITFTGRLTSLSVSYKMFKPDGSPLRAVVKLQFKGFTKASEEVKKKNANSPDLTHVITVKEGDSLPMLCEEIYQNSLLYLEVARINNLVNFRQLKPGMELVFPPIKK